MLHVRIGTIPVDDRRDGLSVLELEDAGDNNNNWDVDISDVEDQRYFGVVDDDL